MKFISGIAGTNNSVIYTNVAGAKFCASGGTRAWRNNNPGNLREGAFARARGAIGAAGGFAVFPDYETGFSAMIALLQMPTYQKLTISGALNRYAPPIENNVENYLRTIEKSTGFLRTTPMKNLKFGDLQKLCLAMSKHEGFIKGEINEQRN